MPMISASLTKYVSFLSAAAMASALGCTKGVSEEDRAIVAAVQRNAPPPIANKLNITFGDQVTLLGYKLETKPPYRANDKLKITFFWRLDRALGPGWKLSTRLTTEQGDPLLNADEIGKLRERRNKKPALPPSDWSLGKVYIDEQTIPLPTLASGKQVKLVVSLRKGELWLEPRSGEFDKRGNLKITQFGVESARRAHTVSQLSIPMLPSKDAIDVDGKLDEAAWASAATLPSLVEMLSGRAPSADRPFTARAKLLWSEKALYLGVDVRDSDLEGGFKKGAKEPPVWKRDALELVLKMGSSVDNKDYYRVGVGIQNLIFDSYYDDFAVPNVAPLGPVGNLDWSSNIKAVTKAIGSIDDAMDDDNGYVMELEIPWASFNRSKPFVAKPKAYFWLNFEVTSGNEALGFVPYYNDKSLQAARRFGKIVLLGPSVVAPPLPVEVAPLTLETPTAIIGAQAAAEAVAAAAEAQAAEAQAAALAASKAQAEALGVLPGAEADGKADEASDDKAADGPSK